MKQILSIVYLVTTLFLLLILPNNTTHTSAIMIDHILTNDIKHNTKPMVLQTVITDHFPMMCYINESSYPNFQNKEAENILL